MKKYTLMIADEDGQDASEVLETDSQDEIRKYTKTTKFLII